MTAADGIATLLRDEWEPSVTGRADVPDVVDAPEDGRGVLILTNDEDSQVRLSTHDKVEVSEIDRDIRDSGSHAEQVIDTVQIDIRIAARDTDGDDVRDDVRARMVGQRDANNDPPTLGGLSGEVKRILNGIRKGYREWDKSSHTLEQKNIRNSDARVTYTVDLEIIERDVQEPL